MSILKLGSRGPLVEKLQEELKRRGYYVEVDGVFGIETESAVMKFQGSNHLNVDGIVGGITWRYLFSEAFPIATPDTPFLQKDLPSLFTNPLSSSFKTSYIEWIDLQEFRTEFKIFNFICQYDRCGFYGHRLLEKPIKAALRNVIDAKLQHELKTFDGCYVVRNSRGRSTLSTHAYGLAIDFNAFENPFNSSEHAFSNKLVACFTRAGFENGGLWAKPIDWMHFQLPWTRDYTKQKARIPELTPEVPEL